MDEAGIGEQWVRAMRRGDDEAAWRLSDQVLARRDPATRDDPALPYHRRWVWDGRPFRGRDVLVRCYHGLGDTLQYARFLPALRRRVASLTLEAPAPLVPLLTTLSCVDRLVAFVPHAPLPPSACDIEIMELSHALRMRPAAAWACLHAAPISVHAGAIGLCWQAGDWDAARSIPPEQVLPVIAGRPAYTLLPRPTNLPVLNSQGCPREIVATAALVQSLSLIVTVDTMIAHLAGALGRPTWLLVPCHADWRWMSSGTQTPWYPTIRIYRQTMPGDWSAMIAQVVDDLRAQGSPLQFARRPAADQAG